MQMMKVRKSAYMKCDEAIKCVFNLNRLDINVYKTLLKNGAARADELADMLQKERSTIYRSLQKLSDCGICKKITKTLKQGGYYHIYEPQSSREIKKQAEECLDSWYASMKQTLQLLNDH
jgi:predicted transcriptional regulator